MVKFKTLKIGLFVLACTIGIYAALACGAAECGGGETLCCIKMNTNEAYYLTRGPITQ